MDKERIENLVACILSDQVPAADIVRLCDEESGLKEALLKARRERQAD